MEVEGRTYERLVLKTHLVHIREPLLDVLSQYVGPAIKPGDTVALSEKLVTICQGRVIHRSLIKPGLLAKLIVRGVTKYDNDVGFSDPAKMQVAIFRAGWWRMLAAMSIGGATRLLWGRRGDFYRIAGNHVSEIDGFNPDTIKPFNEFAMLGPEDPPRDAQAVEDSTGWPTLIMDANNVNIEILGMSKGVQLSRSAARLALLDNPIGQSDNQTPIALIRPVDLPKK